jgi:hypothetical protein
MESDSKKQFQHFVPNFYLSGWETTVDQKPRRVWVYEKDRKPYHAAIKNIGGEDNYYAIQKRDGSTDIETVERFLGGGESRAGKVFAKIKNAEALSERDCQHFAEFLAALVRRSPYSIEKSKGLVHQFLPQVINPLVERANRIEDEARRDRALQDIAKVEANVMANPDSVAKAAILEPSDIANFVVKMDWAFFHCRTAKFVTSDNPFVYSVGLGIGDFENGHVIIPISSEVSFQARNSTNFASGYFNITENEASKINERIVGHAHRQVFACDESVELEKIVQTKFGVDLH